MEAVSSYETSADFYQTTCSRIPEDSNFTLSEISGSHGGEYEDYSILEYCDLYLI
jgi:hypothetical protein